MNNENGPAVALPTIRRLPLYYSILQKASHENVENISSSQIAKTLQLEPIQVRKDLASIGITGQAGVGFPVAELVEAINDFLGWDNTTDAFVIGAGNLGAALIGYHGFEENGLNIVAMFDNDAVKIGKKIHGKEILDIDRLPNLVRRMHVHIAILTVPAYAAQAAADIAVEAGIKAIWNFTPTKLNVPEDVIVERVDLAASLAVLSSKVAARLKAEMTI